MVNRNGKMGLPQYKCLKMLYFNFVQKINVFFIYNIQRKLLHKLI